MKTALTFIVVLALFSADAFALDSPAIELARGCQSTARKRVDFTSNFY